MDTKSLVIGILLGGVVFGGGAFILLDTTSDQGPQDNNSTNDTMNQSKYKDFTETQKQSVLGPQTDNITTDTSYVTVEEVKDRYFVNADSSVQTFYTTSSSTDKLVEYDSGNETYVFKSSRNIGLVVETENEQRYLASILPAQEG